MGDTEEWKKIIGNKDQGFFHHAYGILGYDSPKRRDQIRAFLESEFGMTTQGNTDFHEVISDRIFVSDIEAVTHMVSKTAFREGREKVFFLAASTITKDAQNKFLKTLEEPKGETLFFIFVPTEEVLLPTIRSRVLFLSGGEKDLSGEYVSFVEEILEAEKFERFKRIEIFALKKDKKGAVEFLNALEVALEGRLDMASLSTKEALLFREIQKARGYLRDTAPSVKMLLEHIGLLLTEVAK